MDLNYVEISELQAVGATLDHAKEVIWLAFLKTLTMQRHQRLTALMIAEDRIRGAANRVKQIRRMYESRTKF